MGPNPIMQARSDFYDDDSIMYTNVCVRVYVRSFLRCFKYFHSHLFAAVWRVVRSFVCFLANPCHQMEFFNLF